MPPGKQRQIEKDPGKLDHPHSPRSTEDLKPTFPCQSRVQLQKSKEGDPRWSQRARALDKHLLQKTDGYKFLMPPF